MGIRRVILAILAITDVCIAIAANSFSRKPAKSPNRNGESRRILVIRIDHKIGDMVICSGFFRELRKANPNARIDLVIHASASQLYEYCPYVDRITIFDWGYSLHLSLATRISRIRRFVKDYFENDLFDVVYVPRWDVDHHAKFIAYFTGGTKRIAYSRKVTLDKKWMEFGLDALMTESIVDPCLRHEAERSWLLLSHETRVPLTSEVIRPELWLTREDREFAETQQFNWSSTETIALGPGAASAKRRWPKERFIELAKRLRSDRHTIILLGGRDDHKLCDDIRTGVGGNCINYAGKTTIRESAALLAKSQLFVGNDSGLLHLAAAVGIPCVEISCHPFSGDKAHPNSPIRFGPLGINAVVCQPEDALLPCRDYCGAMDAHCILKVSTNAVVSKATPLLGLKLQ